MSERKVDTMQLHGNNYAKVAERLKAFKEDNPKSKQESAFEYDPDKSVVFNVYLWRDKSELIDLMKSGVTDTEILRSSADANGHARSSEVGKETKDFEKLETIALGRALANIGYLGSGEIASLEEMEDFKRFQEQKRNELVKDGIADLRKADTLEDLRKRFKGLGELIREPEIVAAKDKRKAEIARAAKPKEQTNAPSES